MPTIAQVAAAVDLHTKVQIEDLGTPVVYGNQDRESLSKGTAAFLTQRVIFEEVRQFILGNVTPGRHFGSIVFLIHVRKGVGDGPRNILFDIVVKSFRSQVIGGAKFLNAQIQGQDEIDGWVLTGVVVPFYFEEF